MVAGSITMSLIGPAGRRSSARSRSPERTAPPPDLHVASEHEAPLPARDPRGRCAVSARLPASAEAAGMARRALDPLEGGMAPALLYDLRLLVTELVTNSVRHGRLPAGAAIELDVFLFEGSARVEVADAGVGFEHSSLEAIEQPAEADVDPRGSGWGLHLVERLSDRWGIARDRGTRVWFEIEARAGSGLSIPGLEDIDIA